MEDDNMIDEESIQYLRSPILFKNGNQTLKIEGTAKLKGEDKFTIIIGKMFEKLDEPIVG